jgi:hypothetical protein
MSNLYIREIGDIDELSSDLEAEDARGLFAKSGIDESFNAIKVGG